MTDPWPFDQPPETVCISLRSVFAGGAPIQHVTHDRDDHGWQFLTPGALREDDVFLVALGQAVALDRTLTELADLPVGWHAWRESVGAPWQRAPNPNDPG